MQRKFEIIHIHTDLKFIHNTKMFEGEYFSNTSIVISDKKPTVESKEDIHLFTNTSQNIDKIVSICNNADVVVFYNLDLIKSKIVLRLSQNVKLIWRFFGVELYTKDYFNFISKKGLKEGHTIEQKIKKKFLKFNFVNTIDSLLNNKEDFNKIFHQAINRLDFMMVLSKEEYTFLKNRWKQLPSFIKIPHFHFSREIIKFDFKVKYTLKKPNIILGNSRSKYNNHIDIIDIVEKHSAKKNYNFSLFFSYGVQDFYAQKVTKKVINKAHFTLMDNFLPKEHFNEFYHTASALVINSYRQLAGANIRMAFEMGVKVYLNDKNIHKKWLENEGFKIFSISDFENDLKNDNLFPDKETADYNFDNFLKFKKRHTKEDFQNELNSKLIS